MRNTAFSLVELLVVVAVISVISAAIVPNFNNYIEGQGLSQSQEQVISDLRSVQNKALAGSGYVNADDTTNTFWGVKFIPGSKGYFSFVTSSDEANLLTACNNAITGEVSISLPRDVVVRGSGVCVFFSFETGNAVGVATGGGDPLTVVLGDPDMTQDTCVGVQVNDYGRIYEVENLQCDL